MKSAFNGPLRAHPVNPRYFTDDSNRAIYMTGSHTWSVMQQLQASEPLDYGAYLNTMAEHGHNFQRFWTWECPPGKVEEFDGPLPYERSAVEGAFDGGNKFDLDRFHEPYFERLRARVVQSAEYGIYSAVMLFQGWCVDKKHDHNPWPAHPFHPMNNVNGINGDPQLTGEGRQVHTLAIPEITKLQKAFIRKVIDTIGDLDCILYEISNESGSHAAEWHYEMIRYIKEYESEHPKRHPVMMTYLYPDGNNPVLFVSPADAVSPGNPGNAGEWNLNPPAADGRKVSFPDTDHLGGIWGCGAWVWKCFTRGHNPIFMDDLKDSDWRRETRDAMGDTRRLAERLDMAAMHPYPYLSTSGYCLADPGKRYLVYQPEYAPVNVWLTGAEGRFSVEWFDPGSKETIDGGTVEGGIVHRFHPPFRGDSVLLLTRV